MQLAASSMKVSIARLMADPDFYIFNYAESSQTSEFLIVNQDVLDKAPFVDNRLERFARGQFTVATEHLSELVDLQPGPRPDRHYIFHHAFVCSTLLARCLAQSDAFFSLKEPQIVRRLADLQRAAKRNPGLIKPCHWNRLLNTHLQLLSKDYDRGDKVVVKASNVANNLLPEILRNTHRGNCLYLHSGLQQFLVSNLKKLQETQRKIPDLLAIFSHDSDFFQQHTMFADISRFGFVKQCALLWLLCNYNFLTGLEAVDAGRVRTLAMEAFLQAPRDMLNRVSRLFQYQPAAEELDRMSGDVLLSHAKNPLQPYDAKLREQEFQSVLRRNRDAIDQATAWINPLVRELDISARLAALAV